MSILADVQIRRLCEDSERPMITPFFAKQVRYRNETPTSSLGELLKAKLCDEEKKPEVVVEEQKPEKKIVSLGLSSYGYDITLGNKFKIFTNVNNGIVDPAGVDESCFIDVERDDDDFVLIPPNSFILAHSKEYFHMPEDVTGIVLGKSTYARVGCVCLATPLEAGWEGIVTLEFANTTNLPMKMYAGQGCAQVLFFQGDVPCEVSYATRGGKYQGQDGGITLPRL